MSRPTPTLGAQFAPSFHRPFLRYLDGDAGAAGAPPSGGEPPAAPPAAPTAPPAAPPAPTPQPPAAPTPPPVNYHGNPDDYVRELREEAKTHRLAAEKAAQDHAAAQAERDAAAAERDQLKRANALLLHAPKYGARADLLLDSSSFMKTFADIDLSKDDDVKKAIEDALERNSAFKAAPSLPGASGPGPQGGQPTTTKPTLEGAVKTRLGS